MSSIGAVTLAEFGGRLPPQMLAVACSCCERHGRDRVRLIEANGAHVGLPDLRGIPAGDCRASVCHRSHERCLGRSKPRRTKRATARRRPGSSRTGLAPN